MGPWSLTTFVLAFGGGVFGAAVGGLWAFCICATMVILGSVLVLAGGSDFLLLQVGIGPIFGPHVGGFASGIAASTYAAAIRKNHPTGAAKDILSPLLDTSWDVLLVGGLFGVFGHVVLQLLGFVPIPWDALALTVVLGCALPRLIFQREMPWGNMDSIREYGYLGTNGYALSWVGWMSPPGRLLFVGLGAGLLSGALAMGLDQALAPMAEAGEVSAAAAGVAPLLMGWAVSGFSLIALQLGAGALQKVPAPHVISLLGAFAYLQTGSVIAAGIAGVFTAFLQELMARMFYNHGSNHIDPPAMAAVVGTLILNLVLPLIG